MVLFGDRAESEILQRTKALYAGVVVLGQDLMSVAVGDSAPTPRLPRTAVLTSRYRGPCPKGGPAMLSTLQTSPPSVTT